jgi:hypothetical protein
MGGGLSGVMGPSSVHITNPLTNFVVERNFLYLYGAIGDEEIAKLKLDCILICQRTFCGMAILYYVHETVTCFKHFFVCSAAMYTAVSEALLDHAMLGFHSERTDSSVAVADEQRFSFVEDEGCLDTQEDAVTVTNESRQN